jgi:hypothetical protein
MSRQSRLRTLVFPGKTGGFAAEVVGFELTANYSSLTAARAK